MKTLMPPRCLAGYLMTVLALVTRAAEDLPPIGLIEFYGFRTVSAAKARQVLGLKEGDPASKGAAQNAVLEQRLEKLPNVERARLAWVCCHEGRTVLFVGVQEQGTPQLEFRAAPLGRVSLPSEAIELDRRFEAALEAAVLKGDAADDTS